MRPLRIGLYSPFFGHAFGGGEKYLGVTAEAIRDAFPHHQVEMVSSVPADVERYQRMLGLDLTGISFRTQKVHGAGLGRRIRRLPGIRRYADLYLSARAIDWTRDYDLLLSMVYVIPAVSRARRGVILCQFPYEVGGSNETRPGVPSLLYRAYSAPYKLLKRRLLGTEVDSFQLVICQSRFVQGWIRRYWDRDSVIINPPIDVPTPEPELKAKQPIILSVGRFFASGHCKRQDLMVETFRRLHECGLGWELHLVGALHRDNPADMRYFEKVQRLAQGYPVHLHPDASLDCLKDLYRRASVYWHAAGHGVDAERRPINLEHFGMTTAEAMGHGIVPVAIARGGQTEVVHDGVNGFLWTSPEELADRTMCLIANPELRERLAKGARAASFRFTRQEFKRKMAASLRLLIAELEAESVPATVPTVLDSSE
jgi:glycosyltransferase involved in cell wall biosynthesis